MIKIFDNIVPLSISNQIKSYVFNENGNQKMPYYYIPDLTGYPEEESINDYGFVSNLLGDGFSLLSQGKGMLLSPLFLLAFSQNFFIDHIFVSRSFFQTPTINPGPQVPHIDMNQPHFVCLYYVNDSDGDTIFFNDNGEEIERASPKQGRVVFFDGAIKHCGSRPSTFPRAVVNTCFHFLN